MKKRPWLKILFALSALFIVAVVIAYLSLDTIVKRAVEKVGPAVTKVDVKLGAARVSPFSGKGELKKFVLGNPPGFKSPSAVDVGAIAIEVVPMSVIGDKVIVRSLRVEGPIITLEGGFVGNNLSKILANVESGEKETPSTKPEAKAQTRKLQLDDIRIVGGKINVYSPLLGGKSASVPLPEVHLTNLGAGPEGITPTELTERLLKAVLQESLKAAGPALGKVGQDAINSATKAGGEAIKDAGKAANEKLGDLFKRK